MCHFNSDHYVIIQVIKHKVHIVCGPLEANQFHVEFIPISNA